MQVIPIATRDNITIPANRYIALHAENVAWGTPKHIVDKFMALTAKDGDEYPGTVLYTPDGVNVEDTNTREPLGTLQAVKESNGNRLVHFRTIDGKHDTVLSRTVIFDDGNLEDANAQHCTLFLESIADKRLKLWEPAKRNLIKAGIPAEHITPVEEALRNGIINGTPIDAYAEAFNILTDEGTVNGILTRLNDELTSGLEAIKNLKTELESENTHE
jgi:hypothetical protein